ncbi:hypothetical protein SKAU_G00090350 [Synaphobranchus kaupii]|uniref:Uncharacterized protein n=1 Tax=Synaphobranchus kaupii TaxID=118154 RepID=A0A9Q1FX13_SYNKA|nr:hypothetical protein SKAU_G00090350 [Synaphobranchus kaupii]
MFLFPSRSLWFGTFSLCRPAPPRTTASGVAGKQGFLLVRGRFLLRRPWDYGLYPNWTLRNVPAEASSKAPPPPPPVPIRWARGVSNPCSCCEYLKHNALELGERPVSSVFDKPADVLLVARNSGSETESLRKSHNAIPKLARAYRSRRICRKGRAFEGGDARAAAGRRRPSGTRVKGRLHGNRVRTHPLPHLGLLGKAGSPGCRGNGTSGPCHRCVRGFPRRLREGEVSRASYPIGKARGLSALWKTWN